MHAEPASKIASDELREIISGDSAEPISVLIQPELPERTFEVTHIVRGGVEITVPSGPASSPARDQVEVAARVAETKGFLEDVLGASPLWLASSRTFVARATPAQLRTIADSPMIEAIWPNRELRPTLAT